MKLKVAHKIFISIAMTTIVSVVTVQLIQRYHFQQGFLRYAQQNLLENISPMIDELKHYYMREGSWQALKGRGRLIFDGPRFGRGKARFREGLMARSERAETLGLLRPGGRRPFKSFGLLDAQGEWIAGAKRMEGSLSKPIKIDGETVGFMVVGPLTQLSDGVDKQFASQQLSGMLWSAVVVLVCAGVAAMLLSHHLSEPIRLLINNVRDLTQGNYQGRIDLQRRDEFGVLAKDFDRLVDALEDSRQSQRQWISDIAHELRTPVTILTGEIECIEDGYTALGPSSLQSFKVEVQKLSLLIDDLHQLSQAESGALVYQFERFDINQEIDRLKEPYIRRLDENKIVFYCDNGSPAMVYGDPLRLGQVIGNLLENSLRYTDSPGVIAVSTALVDDYLRLTVEDSSPGVPEASLHKLFHRLYRVDPSRNRNTGAAGLGLAICEAIVKAHRGQISARHSELGGLAIDIDLPVCRGSH